MVEGSETPREMAMQTDRFLLKVILNHPAHRTQWEADQAEAKIKREIFEGKYDIAASGKEKLKHFIVRDYLPWTKINKASFRNEESRSKMILERLGSKSFREITPEISRNSN